MPKTKSSTPDHVDGDPSAARSDASPGIGFLLARAHRRFRDAIVEALEGSGLNPGHVAILGAVSALPGMSQAELTAITGIEKSSMVLFVDALERDGWLRRAAHDGDRRAHALALTTDGRRRLRAIGPRLHAVDEALLEGFTATERRRLIALLQRFTNDG